MINPDVGYTIYVSGPMGGIPDLNEPAFRAVAANLMERGYAVIVPHDVEAVEHDGPCPRSHGGTTQTGHGTGCFLRGDVRALTYADAIYMLEGWECSVGARLELQVATACGISVMIQSPIVVGP